MTYCLPPKNLEPKGVYLDELEQGRILEVQTENHLYRIVNCGKGEALICGHPEYCPIPAAATISGSTWGGSMLKMGFVGIGMRLEFRMAGNGVVVTSRVQHIHRC